MTTAHHHISDPIEKIIATALDARGVDYVHDGSGSTNGLDFWLPTLGTYIECKAYHSPRIAEQMTRAPDIIVVQGIVAAHAFAALISPAP